MALATISSRSLIPPKQPNATHKSQVAASRSQAFGSSNGKAMFGEVASFHPSRTSRSVARTSTLTVQAGFFGRVSRVIGSYLNSGVDQLEDPEKILDAAVEEMQENIVKMRQANARLIANQKMTEAKYKQYQEQADKYYNMAQLALKKGNEVLARDALQKRQAAQTNADSFKARLTEAEGLTNKLKNDTRVLEEKISEARAKKEQLKARIEAANVSEEFADLFGGFDTNNAMAAFEKMELKVNEKEELAKAKMGMDYDPLAAEYAKLESSTVDDELEMMRKQLTGGTKEEKSSMPAATGIEAELEELRRKAREQ